MVYINRLFLVGLLSFLAVSCDSSITPAQTSIVYVNAGATGTSTGVSWKNAYPSLQDALAGQAVTDAGPDSPVEIWVVAGIYIPGADEAAVFILPSYVSIYGGFTGTEEERSERDFLSNVTILSGDIDGDDDSSLNGVIEDPSDADTFVGTNSRTIVAASSTEESILDGFLITGAKNEDGGGAVSITGFGVNLQNLTISGNRSQNGGAVYLGNSDSGNDVEFNNVIISGNYATNNGGGIYCTGGASVILTNVAISSNGAQRGAGFYSDICTASFFDVTVNENSAHDSGGGIQWSGTDGTASGLTLVGNTATEGSGGGLFANEGTTVFIDRAKVFGNTAEQNGGGLYLKDVTMSFYNIALTSNQAGVNGGAIYTTDTAPYFTNLSASLNEADNGAAFFNGSGGNPTIQNSILYNNTGGCANSGSKEICNLSGATPVVNYSLVQNSGGSTSWDGSLGTDGGNNIDANPMFAGPAGADEELGTEDDSLVIGTESPAVDAGNSEAPLDADESAVVAEGDLDIRELERVVGDAIDLGAYETQE